MPFKATVNSVDSLISVEILTFATNPEVNPAHFTPPSLTTLRAQATWNSHPVTLDVRYTGERVLVALTLNDHPMTIILDSGAAQTSLPDALAQRLTLNTAPVGRSRGIGSKIFPSYLAELSSMQVGGLTFHHPVVFLSQLPRGIPGLLGYQFFYPFPVEVNLHTQKMIIYPTGGYRPPPGAIELPLDLAWNWPVITAQIPGGEAKLLIDTGAPRSLILFRPWVKRARLVEQPGGTLSGLGGSERSGLVTLTHLKLSNTVIHHIQAQVVEGTGLYPDGIIGLGFLSRLSGFAFDYRNKKTYFMPKPWLGITLTQVENGRVRVTSVGQETPAERAGLLADDELITADGETITTQRQLRELIVAKRAGDTMTFHILRGQQPLDFSVILGPSFE